MQKYIRFPFLFFFVAACIGLGLRWHFISPFQGLKFSYWLHAHSHLMFLGWIFNLLNLAFIQGHITELGRSKYLKLLTFIQVLLIGMLICFPLQGYGFYSITISILHTISVGVFSFWFFRDIKNAMFDPSSWFAKVSLILSLLSAIGPFSLGPLMANGMAQTKWYYFAVYYYLHFQYNGVFTFGVLSLFFSLLKAKGIIVAPFTVKRFANLMLVSCLLGYSLSTLWANPGLIFNIIGFVAAMIQVTAFIYFISIIRSIPFVVVTNVSAPARILFAVALLSFAVKIILQLVSVHPSMALLAYEIRNYVMAYLHLVLLGMISTFLLAWSIEMEWIRKPSTSVIVLFLVGLIGMEMLLINPVPWNDSLFSTTNLLFLFSVMLVFAIGMITLRTLNKERS